MADSTSDCEELNDEVLEDYYAFLNVSKEASQEDITNAYRHMSKLYHPDKHHPDPVRKRDAEILFNKIKKAHEILIDPHKRAIYDTLGLKGLETDGWEIVQRTKTPQEIREEYERLAQEREERRLQQRTNPKGTVSVGIDATDLFELYEDDLESRGYPSLEIKSMTISQSIDAPLTMSDTATLSGTLTTQNGTGNGTVACSVRHVVSAKTWTECEIGAGNGLLFSGKVFRTLTKTCFGTIQGIFHATPFGLKPGIQALVAKQLDKHTVGYLTWKAGHQSCMNTMIVWDSNAGHFVGSIQFGIPNTFVMVSYTHKILDAGKVKGSVKLGTFGAIVEYGCEKKVSQHSIIGASVMIGIPSGITLKLKVHRANQNYIFPIFLSEEILPSAVFYGTVAPILGWYALKVLIITPYQQRQKERETQRAREVNATKLVERRKEAAAAVALMQETYLRIKEREESKGGLVIIEAFYGKLTSIEHQPDRHSVDVMEVTIPLQCLVRDSRLILYECSKSNLAGFYDPCLGEDKVLLVKYKYRNMLHQVKIADEEPLKIPKESHLLHS